MKKDETTENTHQKVMGASGAEGCLAERSSDTERTFASKNTGASGPVVTDARVCPPTSFSSIRLVASAGESVCTTRRAARVAHTAERPPMRNTQALPPERSTLSRAGVPLPKVRQTLARAR